MRVVEIWMAHGRVAGHLFLTYFSNVQSNKDCRNRLTLRFTTKCQENRKLVKHLACWCSGYTQSSYHPTFHSKITLAHCWPAWSVLTVLFPRPDSLFSVLQGFHSPFHWKILSLVFHSQGLQTSHFLLREFMSLVEGSLWAGNHFNHLTSLAELSLCKRTKKECDQNWVELLKLNRFKIVNGSTEDGVIQ